MILKNFAFCPFCFTVIIIIVKTIILEIKAMPIFIFSYTISSFSNEIFKNYALYMTLNI